MITKDEFDNWMRDPITVKYFACLEQTKNLINETLTDTQFILKQDNTIIYELGRRDMLDDLLITGYEDVNQQEEVDNE